MALPYMAAGREAAPMGAVMPEARSTKQAVPEQNLAVLRAHVASQLMAELPLNLDAKLALEARMLVHCMVDEIMALCASDPHKSSEIAQAGIAAAAQRLRTYVSEAQDKAAIIARNGEAPAPRMRVIRRKERVTIFDKDGKEIAMNDADFDAAQAQAETLFAEDAMPEALSFERVDGAAYWRIPLEGGRVALVPAADIRLIRVTLDGSGMLRIQELTNPRLLGSRIQSDFRQVQLSVQTVAGAVGASLGTEDLARRLQESQALLDELVQMYHQQQEQLFGALRDVRASVKDAARSIIHIEDVPLAPEAFTAPRLPHAAAMTAPALRMPRYSSAI